MTLRVAGRPVEATSPKGGGSQTTLASGARKVGANHRTLSTYLNQLIEHGLAIEQAVEPPPVGEWLSAKRSEDLVPVFFVLRCRRERSDLSRHLARS